jgi:hypothetical protein
MNTLYQSDRRLGQDWNQSGRGSEGKITALTRNRNKVSWPTPKFSRQKEADASDC